MNTIPLFKVFMGKDLDQVLATLRSGYIGQGTKVEAFEKQLEKVFGFGPILTVNSCTSAIDIVCHMLGLQEGDEVITTPQTCTATNSPPYNRGATLVWSDVDPNTGLIDPEDVKRKITSRTKLIIAVNWAGNMPDYAALKSFGIPVLEDAAHGPYWSARERGDYIVWSFQAIKHLTTGDGGALFCNDPKRVKLLRWYGLDRESSADFRCSQNIQEIGYKYHMNDVSASIGLVNLPHLEQLVFLHNQNALFYDRNIYNPKIKKPLYDQDNPSWIYTIRCDTRDDLADYLKGNGIASSQVHARNDKHDGFARSKYAFMLPGLSQFDATQLSIPVGWWIDTSDREHIVRTLNAY